MVEGFAIEPELVRPFTRSEYDQMVALGLFQEERVELLRGTLVKISPQLAPHASTIRKLTGYWRVQATVPLQLVLL